jgi:uracil-DNA glycosylase
LKIKHLQQLNQNAVKNEWFFWKDFEDEAKKVIKISGLLGKNYLSFLIV